MSNLLRILPVALLLIGTANSATWATQSFSSPLDLGGTEQLDAFRTVGSGWTTTSSGTSSIGAPVDLTWSMALDGTNLPRGLGEPASPNDLIAFLDGIHQGGASPGGADLTQRDWFPLVESSFERWDAVSGVNFNYEPNDDGATFSPSNRGILGTRGDYRIGGHSIDGQTSPTFLAYNFFPNYAEMVIDTDEVDRWSNPEGNYIRFRNMLMHEMGHGLGLNHLESSDADFLMEPFLATAFDGPQLDDILGIHRLYGDANEENGGNDTYLDATWLGKFRPGKSKSFGVDAADTIVDFTETDFLSIDDDSDTDFFKFTVRTPSLVDLTLTPLGPAYQEGSQGGFQSLFDTAAQSDLTLALYDNDGTSLLDFANENGSGMIEEISSFRLDTPGDYYVKIQGMQNAAQFYQLDIDVEYAFPRDPFGFFDDLFDLFDQFDPFGRFDDALANFDLIASHPIPEPSSGLLMFAGLAFCGLSRRRTR